MVMQLLRWMCGLVVLALAGCAAEPPPHLRAPGGDLAPCPHRPNCVSSLAGDATHHVQPLQYAGTVQHAQLALIKVVESMPGGTVVQASGDRLRAYVRAEFTTARMQYVDDVEFLLPVAGGIIHLRSASRVGFSDRGVNRARVETIRNQLLPTIYEISILRPGAK